MATSDHPLDIVVRFSTSHPDITLHISTPAHTSGLTLKQLLRARLESPSSESRLRLIHAGKVLSDPSSLSPLVPLSPPPPRVPDPDSKSAKAKGKLPSSRPGIRRVYIHCSISDPLSPLELSAEKSSAAAADAALRSPSSSPSSLSLPGARAGASPSSSPGTIGVAGGSGDGTPAASTTPAPRGFDRLLAAGFTAPEVAALRTQFLAIQAHTHTPDSMPTGGELLALEERWLDNSNSGNGGLGGGGGEEGGGAGGGFGSEDAGALEDMLYGNLMGFFWPVGAMGWLMREEGVWSRRRQIAVLSGFLVNLVFGFLRVMN